MGLTPVVFSKLGLLNTTRMNLVQRSLVSFVYLIRLNTQQYSGHIVVNIMINSVPIHFHFILKVAESRRRCSSSHQDPGHPNEPSNRSQTNRGHSNPGKKKSFNKASLSADPWNRFRYDLNGLFVFSKKTPYQCTSATCTRSC